MAPVRLRPSGIFIAKDDTIYVTDPESGPDLGAYELMGIKKASASAAPGTERVTAFIEDMESHDSAHHSGAEGLGVDAQGNVYGAVVRRQQGTVPEEIRGDFLVSRTWQPYRPGFSTRMRGACALSSAH